MTLMLPSRMTAINLVPITKNCPIIGQECPIPGDNRGPEREPAGRPGRFALRPAVVARYRALLTNYWAIFCNRNEIYGGHPTRQHERHLGSDLRTRWIGPVRR